MRFDSVEVFVSVSASFVNLHLPMNCDQSFHLKWLRWVHHCQIRQNLEQGYYFLKTGGYLKKMGYKMVNINFCLSFFTFRLSIHCILYINSPASLCIWESSRQIVMNFPNPKCCHNQIKDCCYTIFPLPILVLLLLIDTLIVMLCSLWFTESKASQRRLDLLERVIYLQKLYLSTLWASFYSGIRISLITY